MGTNLGSLGVFLTTEKRLAFPILVPFARPGDFPRGWTGLAGVPKRGNNLLMPRRTCCGVGTRCVFSHGRSSAA